MNNENEEIGWTAVAKLSMLVLIIMLIKNLGLVTVYAIRKFIDNNNDPAMRPKTVGINMT